MPEECACGGSCSAKTCGGASCACASKKSACPLVPSLTDLWREWNKKNNKDEQEQEEEAKK